MHIEIVLSVIASLFLLSSGTVLPYFHTHTDSRLKESHVNRKETVHRSGDCRQLCAMADSCMAVTVFQTTVDKFTCLIAESFDVNYLESFNTLYTTTLSKAHCSEPFKLVDGVGCLFFENNLELSFTDALESCPAGSSLISPVSLVFLKNLQDFLLDSKASGAMSEIKNSYHMGLVRITGTDTWEWLSGGKFQMKDDEGLYPFSYKHPGPTGLCANIHYNVEND